MKLVTTPSSGLVPILRTQAGSIGIPLDFLSTVAGLGKLAVEFQTVF